jgi:hypothetical protein
VQIIIYLPTLVGAEEAQGERARGLGGGRAKPRRAGYVAREALALALLFSQSKAMSRQKILVRLKQRPLSATPINSGGLICCIW